MVIAVLVVILLILHQDNWLWERDENIWGFMPVGLFYHACLSLAAAATWLLATKIAWPVETVESATRATSSGTHSSQSGEVPR